MAETLYAYGVNLSMRPGLAGQLRVNDVPIESFDGSSNGFVSEPVQRNLYPDLNLVTLTVTGFSKEFDLLRSERHTSPELHLTITLETGVVDGESVRSRQSEVASLSVTLADLLDGKGEPTLPRTFSLRFRAEHVATPPVYDGAESVVLSDALADRAYRRLADEARAYHERDLDTLVESSRLLNLSDVRAFPYWGDEQQQLKALRDELVTDLAQLESATLVPRDDFVCHVTGFGKLLDCRTRSGDTPLKLRLRNGEESDLFSTLGLFNGELQIVR